MKFLYVFLIIAFSNYIKGQCATTITFVLTPPTCSTCCDGKATASNSCAITYTWMPGAVTSYSNGALCAGSIYTVYAGMASTLCCGATVGTATLFVPAAPTSITELKEIENINVSPNPSEGKINISSGKYFSDTEININDITGKLIFQDNFSGTQKNIELNLKDGMYFIFFRNKENGQQVNKKIIIQK